MYALIYSIHGSLLINLWSVMCLEVSSVQMCTQSLGNFSAQALHSQCNVTYTRFSLIAYTTMVISHRVHTRHRQLRKKPQQATRCGH